MLISRRGTVRRICGTDQPEGGNDDAADPDERDGDVNESLGEECPVRQRPNDDAALDY